MNRGDIAVYVLVDEGLSAGLKCTQALHAVVELTHFTDVREWVLNHKTVVVLEASLASMLRIKTEIGLPYVSFIDRDLGPNITAIAFSPMKRDGISNKLLKHLPLAKFN